MNDCKTMTCEQARNYDLVEYLSTLGFLPKKIVRNQYWYLSPFREEQTPSFKVNRILNRWMDFGEGKGGNLIDFAIAYHRCTVGEFLKILDAKPMSIPQRDPRPRIKDLPLEGKIIILHTATLTKPYLLSYLDRRRIPLPIAANYCKEVCFELYGKTIYAIGFSNNSGGWELRNALFKGSSSPKTFTSIFSGSPASTICVFEGFFDFLSFLTLIPSNAREGMDYLILNSLVFFESARQVIETYAIIRLFLDNNPAGRTVTTYAISLSKSYNDESHLFHRYQDLNDYLVYFGKPQSP